MKFPKWGKRRIERLEYKSVQLVKLSLRGLVAYMRYILIIKHINTFNLA